MSWEAQGWAMEQVIPPTEFRVLLVLANRMNSKTGRCDPAIGRIAEEAVISESAARRTIKELADLGLLVICDRKATTSQYDLQLNMRVPKKGEKASPIERPEGVSNRQGVSESEGVSKRQEGGVNLTGGGSQSDTRTLESNQYNRTLKKEPQNCQSPQAAKTEGGVKLTGGLTNGAEPKASVLREVKPTAMAETEPLAVGTAKKAGFGFPGLVALFPGRQFSGKDRTERGRAIGLFNDLLDPHGSQQWDEATLFEEARNWIAWMLRCDSRPEVIDFLHGVYREPEEAPTVATPMQLAQANARPPKAAPTAEDLAKVRAAVSSLTKAFKPTFRGAGL